MTKREHARSIMRRHLDRGDALSWFEELYASASADPAAVPWADLVPNPLLQSWLGSQPSKRAPRRASDTRRALDVGCGLGDNALALARAGYQVTAFDVSSTAIAWAKRRSPGVPVEWVQADALAPPDHWKQAFDLVVEVYTLQVLPPPLRPRLLAALAGCVSPGGTLLIICRGREPSDPEGEMPWPLTRGELNALRDHGLTETSFDDLMDDEDPPVRRFVTRWRKPPPRE